METFADLIDAFGVSALARIIGKTESHIRVMKTRKSIPPEFWGELILAAPRFGLNGVTHRNLLQLRRNRFNGQTKRATIAREE